MKIKLSTTVIKLRKMAKWVKTREGYCVGFGITVVPKEIYNLFLISMSLVIFCLLVLLVKNKLTVNREEVGGDNGGKRRKDFQEHV